VTVNLYADTNEDGIPDNVNAPLASQVTNGMGFYSFGGLTPGNYVVGFVTPAGYQPTIQLNTVGNDPTDSDADPNTGWTGTINLISGETDNTNDAGFIQLAAVGNFVWQDNNGNGIQDPGELGVPNVTVNLLSNGVVVGTTTTNNFGEYSFTGLLPGQYQVEFVLPSGFSYTVNNGPRVLHKRPL
jgi:protocatechuate 3,4-dioxygenase beta subunit